MPPVDYLMTESCERGNRRRRKVPDSAAIPGTALGSRAADAFGYPARRAARPHTTGVPQRAAVPRARRGTCPGSPAAPYRSLAPGVSTPAETLAPAGGSSDVYQAAGPRVVQSPCPLR
ncbi:hypothetical protein GCM10027570_30940 [Streptomonospora sediminis]